MIKGKTIYFEEGEAGGWDEAGVFFICVPAVVECCSGIVDRAHTPNL